MYFKNAIQGPSIRTLLISLVLGLSLQAQANTNYPPTAHQTIEHVFEQLFANLDELLATYDESPAEYYEKINAVVSPWIDYDSFAKGVMGRKYYTMASQEQRDRFRETFIRSMVETYGKSLLSVENPDFEIDLPEGYDGSGNSAQVKQTLSAGSGQVVVIYSMGKSETGRWQVKNLILEGINLGKTFRSQFARAALEHDEDLDKVIDNWSPEA